MCLFVYSFFVPCFLCTYCFVYLVNDGYVLHKPCFVHFHGECPNVLLVFSIDRIEFVETDKDIDTIEIQPHRRLVRPTQMPVTGISAKERLIKELYEDSVRKGEFTLDFDSLDENEKLHMQNVISKLTVRKEDLDEDERRFFDEFEKKLSANPNYESMSPDDLLDSLGLTKEDKDSLKKELKSMVSSAEEEMKHISLQHLFPSASSSIEDFNKGLQKAVAEDPSIKEEVSSWLQSVQSKLGNDIYKLEKLSDEEFASIALPPENLRKVLKKYMPTSDRLGDINFDAGLDPREAFINKQYLVC